MGSLSLVRKILTNVTISTVAIGTSLTLGTSIAHANEPFVGHEATTTKGVINPNTSENRSTAHGGNSASVSLGNYWTPIRMMQATPIDESLSVRDDLGRSAHETPNKLSAPKILDREQPASSPVTKWSSSAGSTAYSRIGNSGAANGKIFFTKLVGGEYKDYVCSGAAVNSNNKSTVITAGHCVHSGQDGEFHKNWVFVPEYTIGIAPHGKFSANYMTTTADWASNGASYKGLAADFGFVTVNPSEGKLLTDVVGGHGLRSGKSDTFSADIIGYPGNRFFGSAMFRCTTPVHTENRESFSFYFEYGCNFGGGASGGPWLEDFDGQLGYIKSVSSFGPTDDASYLGAPIITEDIWKMFDTTANRKVG